MYKRQPRGGGNVKGEDIKKIAQTDSIDSYVKRINSVADLVDYDIIETKETLANQSPKRAKNFKRTVMLTGVNDSSKETKFVSGAYKLVEGKHLDCLLYTSISGGNLINDSSFMLNITTLGQSYLILISIIVLSVLFASSLILIKKPKEILSKIS